jgi:hypothetical protein
VSLPLTANGVYPLAAIGTVCVFSGNSIEVCKGLMNIISAHHQVGTSRDAAELCGTTHKTVKRVIERAEVGGPPSRGRGPGTSSGHRSCRHQSR